DGQRTILGVEGGERVVFLLPRVAARLVPRRPAVPEVVLGAGGVGRLLVVLMVVPPPVHGDPLRVVGAEAPAGHVEEMDAVVRELAAAPVPPPVPVVVDEVVAIRP